MDVLLTVKMDDSLRKPLIEQFPTVRFFFDDIESEKLEEAEVIVTYGNDLTQSLIERAKKLKWIMVASAGVENIPASIVLERDILVTNAQGIHRAPMSETIVGYIIAISRSLPTIERNSARKIWDQSVRSTEVEGQTILLLGPGTIGQEVAKRLKPFGVKLIGMNRAGRHVPLMDETITYDELLETVPKADVVLSILPSTEETRRLWKKEHFEAMKETALFCNFGRGDFVAERDIVDALQRKLVKAVVLDVFENEPLPEDSLLWDFDNCYITPHISSESDGYMPRTLDIFRPNLTAWLNGDPLSKFTNVVDMKKGY